MPDPFRHKAKQIWYATKNKQLPQWAVLINKINFDLSLETNENNG